LFHEYRRKRHILFPEVLKVLKEIYKVYRLGLITNGLPELQWQKIKGAGIELYFENIIISGEINVRKPKEEIFLFAIKRFNTTKENCVMVGNSLNSDILGANNVGIYSIWINRINKKKIKSEIKPNKIITSLLELPEIIKKYFQK
jgi:putative hydrolase of the HAD superfamily